jgi:antitoxin YefM
MCPVQNIGQGQIMLDTISYTQLRNRLAKTLDKVTQDRAPVLITRQKGKPAVLISMEDYAALEETVYLLRSPKNAARLRAGREQVEKEIARRARRRR